MTDAWAAGAQRRVAECEELLAGNEEAPAEDSETPAAGGGDDTLEELEDLLAAPGTPRREEAAETDDLDEAWEAAWEEVLEALPGHLESQPGAARETSTGRAQAGRKRDRRPTQEAQTYRDRHGNLLEAEEETTALITIF